MLVGHCAVRDAADALPNQTGGAANLFPMRRKALNRPVPIPRNVSATGRSPLGSGRGTWVVLAHRADKWIRFSALSDALVSKGSSGSIPKGESTFGSEALAASIAARLLCAAAQSRCASTEAEARLRRFWAARPAPSQSRR
jgi:hypothetical protein